MDFGERLLSAIKESPLKSIRKFSEAVGAEKVKGSSYAVIHRYLKGTAKPPAEFTEAAAKILGVRGAWLAFGEGEPTAAGEALAGQRGVVQRGRVGKGLTEEEFWQREEAFIASLPLGDDGREFYRREALLRFDRMLSDAHTPDSPWTGSQEAREALIRAAGVHLVAVDAGIEAGGKRDDPEHPFWDELLLRQSRSGPWNVMWYDQALALFAQRVRGLGVRTGGWYDAHERHDATIRNPAPY